jgi:hypothetical protein
MGASLGYRVGVDETANLCGPERVVFCELSQAFGDAEASEVIALEQVVACVVRRRPMRDGIDV